jgi:hypothetical protein
MKVKSKTETDNLSLTSKNLKKEIANFSLANKELKKTITNLSLVIKKMEKEKKLQGEKLLRLQKQLDNCSPIFNHIDL